MIDPAFRSALIAFAAVTAAGFGVLVATAQSEPDYVAIVAAPAATLIAIPTNGAIR